MQWKVMKQHEIIYFTVWKINFVIASFLSRLPCSLGGPQPAPSHDIGDLRELGRAPHCGNI